MRAPAALRGRIFAKSAQAASTDLFTSDITPQKVDGRADSRSTILRIDLLTSVAVDLNMILNGSPSGGGAAVDRTGKIGTTVGGQVFQVFVQVVNSDTVNFQISAIADILWMYVSEVVGEEF